MKYTAFILSLLILTMSVLTCTDGVTCENGLVVEQSAHNDTHDEVEASHDHSEDSQDTCSPFCACQCCGLSISLTVFVAVLQKHRMPALVYQDHYAPSYSQEYLGSIWHPPTV
ncbi:hypothetical protein [Microscilla marina]|nr:hypothetical protein [Microscilla marina]